MIGGKPWEFSTDYRLFVRYSVMLTNKDNSRVVEFLKDNGLPVQVESITALNELYFPTEEKQEEEGASKQTNYLFKYDILWDLVFSAFWEKYGIDLSEVQNLSFAKFKVLLAGISGTKLNDVLDAWATDVRNLKGGRLKNVKNIRRVYPLGCDVQFEKVEARDRRMKEYVKQRFMEVMKRG